MTISPSSQVEGNSPDPCPPEVRVSISPTALARAAEISVPYASQILAGKRQTPPAVAKIIEAMGGPSRHELRPDIFDPPADAAAISSGVASELDGNDALANASHFEGGPA